MWPRSSLVEMSAASSRRNSRQVMPLLAVPCAAPHLGAGALRPSLAAGTRAGHQADAAAANEAPDLTRALLCSLCQGGGTPPAAPAGPTFLARSTVSVRLLGLRRALAVPCASCALPRALLQQQQQQAPLPCQPLAGAVAAWRQGSARRRTAFPRSAARAVQRVHTHRVWIQGWSHTRGCSAHLQRQHRSQGWAAVCVRPTARAAAHVPDMDVAVPGPCAQRSAGARSSSVHNTLRLRHGLLIGTGCRRGTAAAATRGPSSLTLRYRQPAGPGNLHPGGRDTAGTPARCSPRPLPHVAHPMRRPGGIQAGRPPPSRCRCALRRWPAAARSLCPTRARCGRQTPSPGARRAAHA